MTGPGGHDMNATSALRALVERRQLGVTPGTGARLAAFKARHPQAVIGHDDANHVWRGHVPLGDCEVFKVRYDYDGDLERGGGLPRLLDDLEAAVRGEDPG